MYKFIVIKKKDVFSYLLLFFLIIILLYSFYYLCKEKKYITPTITNYISQTASKEASLDFNGDGKIDTLEVIEEKNTYIVKIKTHSKDYYLSPSDNSDIIGQYSSSFPLKINTLDLSRDGIPEIIVRTFKDNKVVNYIFTWNEDNFTNIYTCTNNILGVLDSNTSKTPKILSASSSQGDSSTNSFIFNGDKLKDTTFSKTTIPNLDLIQSFINLIEVPYELSDIPDIFSSSIDKTELKLLWNLNKDIYNYSFQNGYFYDTDWDDEGNTSTINWYLSFEEVKNSDSSTNKKELLIYIIIEKDSFNQLKISSIQKVYL